MIQSCAYNYGYPAVEREQVLDNQALSIHGAALANMLNQTGFMKCGATETEDI